jgi:hypothetical protein
MGPAGACEQALSWRGVGASSRAECLLWSAIRVPRQAAAKPTVPSNGLDSLPAASDFSSLSLSLRPALDSPDDAIPRLAKKGASLLASLSPASAATTYGDGISIQHTVRTRSVSFWEESTIRKGQRAARPPGAPGPQSRLADKIAAHYFIRPSVPRVAVTLISRTGSRSC